MRVLVGFKSKLWGFGIGMGERDVLASEIEGSRCGVEQTVKMLGGDGSDLKHGHVCIHGNMGFRQRSARGKGSQGSGLKSFWRHSAPRAICTL